MYAAVVGGCELNAALSDLSGGVQGRQRQATGANVNNIAITRSVAFVATSPASGVEWGAHVCRLLSIAIG